MKLHLHWVDVGIWIDGGGGRFNLPGLEHQHPGVHIVGPRLGAVRLVLRVDQWPLSFAGLDLGQLKRGRPDQVVRRELRSKEEMEHRNNVAGQRGE